MNEHTLGPWDWGHFEDGILGVYATSPVSTIAIIRAGPNAAGHARLIAAAPDLLDALEHIADELAAEASGIKNPALINFAAKLLDVALPAIAKAKGEAI